MHPALQHTGHRPWPLPNDRWIWRQDWLDLAFIHHRVPAATLAARLPAGLRLQEFDGSAWLGLVPFRMHGVTRRHLPAAPVLSSFAELNLRTYVERDGKPGVWFLSLDAASRAVVFGGRRFYGLPYHLSRARLTHSQGRFHFQSTRSDGGAAFEADYRACGATFTAQPGGFDHWATERYCLYAAHPRRGLLRVEVHHAPWPLQAAEVDIRRNEVLAAAGVDVLDAAPLCHFSSGVRVVSYAAQRVTG